MKKIRTLVIYDNKKADELGLNVPEDVQISYAHPKFWNGAPRPIHDAVYAPNRPDIEKAHEDAGKVIYREEGDSTPKPKKTSHESSQEPTAPVKDDTVEVSESFVSTGRDRGPEASKEEDTQPKENDDAVQQAEGQKDEGQEEVEHWSSLSWPKMRSLATQYTGEPIKSKDQAKEVLLDAEAEGKL